MLLQLFIYLNIFLGGAAVALAGWYAYVHFSSKKHGDTPNKTVGTDMPELPQDARERLLKRAENQFELIVDHAADELQFDLKATGDAVTSQLKNVSDNIVTTEMKRYKSSLEELREQTETSIGSAAAEVAKHQVELQKALSERLKELEAALAQDIAAEKQRLAKQLDDKLAGAVTAFLVETLGHNVDLGAQAQYLTETLEAHKADLLKEISDEG